MACTKPITTGGSGGSTGNGGSGGGSDECQANSDCTPGQACRHGVCVDPNTECIPTCGSGEFCVSGTCESQYGLRFIDLPSASGPILTVYVEARPYPGQPVLKASELVCKSNYKGLGAVDAPATVVDGQDNVFSLSFDYSKDQTVPTDQNPLEIICYPNSGPANFITGNVSIDNAGPRATPDRLPAMGFKRNDVVLATAAIDDLHIIGGSAMARLVGPGEADPVQPDLMKPSTLEGWVSGIQRAKPNDRTWQFSLDQRHTRLPFLSGSLAVWIWTRDGLGNTKLSHSTDPDFMAKVSRDAWTGEVPGPVFAGIKGAGGGAGGNGAGITNVPAVDKNGNVAVLVSSNKDNFDLFNPMNGVRASYTFNVSGDAVAPVLAADGNFYTVSFDGLNLIQISAGSLSRLNTCATVNHAAITSPPVLVKPGAQELASYSRSDGTLAQVGVDTPTTPMACLAEVNTRNLNAGNTSPLATVNSTGQNIIIVGGQRPDTLSTWNLGADGSFTQLNSFAPAAYDVLRDIPMAMDHDTVYAAPRFRAQASAYQYTDTFDTAPTERFFVFEGAENDKVGAPIVSAHAIVYPTSKGLRALARFGPWGQDAVLAPDEVFKAPAVAGEGDILYAINYTGKLYAIKYQETPAPTLKVEWTLQIGGMGENFSASPALTCGGVLVMASELAPSGRVHAVIVDSRGLDPEAPWPKVLHDAANTSNQATSLACP